MFKNYKTWLIVILSLISLLVITVLGIRTDLIILEPKGPVGAIQKELIMYSIYFMLAILIIVYALFTYMVIKYRDQKKFDSNNYKPDMHGSTKLEIIWTIIPIIIVIALSIPNAKALYELKKPPASTVDKEPIVIHATAADWKWIFSYPEENIETVNYVNVPEDHPILFKITAADSMASFWVPQIGGQIYGMPGMVNDLYLQADESGVYKGRNSNFTGEGMTHQQFNLIALDEQSYQNWVKETQENAPKLLEETYEKLLLPDTVEEMTFSSTHLEFVDHGKNSTYAMSIREKYGVEIKGVKVKTGDIEKNNSVSNNSSHSNH